MTYTAKQTLEWRIGDAHELYKEARNRDIRADHMSIDAIQDMNFAEDHMDYLLEQYFTQFVNTVQIESD